MRMRIRTKTALFHFILRQRIKESNTTIAAACRMLKGIVVTSPNRIPAIRAIKG